MRDWLLPPNLITLARLAFTPWIGFALARGDYRAAFPVLMVVGLSDALDGWLARRFHWQSALGERLDPIADKLMLAVVYLGLGLGGALPLWLVALVLGRDVLILGFAACAMLFTPLRRFPPTFWGKSSTICQMTLCALAACVAAWPGFALAPVVPVLVPVTAVATVWSGLHYGWVGVRLWRGAG